ncbi:MAG: hypothetical protein U1E36_07320 [Rickettsiales bacterium]
MYLDTAHNYGISGNHPPAPPVANIEERKNAAKWLTELTSIPFLTSADGKGPIYTGKVSISQMDRLNYVASVCGVKFRNTLPGDAATLDIHQLHIDQCQDMNRLQKLAEAEPARRQTEASAADYLSAATKHPWCWDGLCLSTQEPEKNSDHFHALHGKIKHFKYSGAFPGENSLAVFPSHGPDGKLQNWISVHSVDLPKLKSLCCQQGQGISL